MNAGAYNQPQEKRCACTLPFSLHLTVMILGIVGLILSIVAIVLNPHIIFVWPMVGGGLSFASGLQGILVRPGSGCFNCHIVLAVFNLVNLGVFGIACLFLVTPFWVIWAIAAFAMELWVTIARFCCKTGVVGAPTMELPVAQPHVVHGQPVAPRVYDDGYKAPYRN